MFRKKQTCPSSESQHQFKKGRVPSWACQHTPLIPVQYRAEVNDQDSLGYRQSKNSSQKVKEKPPPLVHAETHTTHTESSDHSASLTKEIRDGPQCSLCNVLYNIKWETMQAKQYSVMAKI